MLRQYQDGPCLTGMQKRPITSRKQFFLLISIKELFNLFGVGSAKCTQCLPGLSSLSASVCQWWIFNAEATLTFSSMNTTLRMCYMKNCPWLHGKSIHADPLPVLLYEMPPGYCCYSHSMVPYV